MEKRGFRVWSNGCWVNISLPHLEWLGVMYPLITLSPKWFWHHYESATGGCIHYFGFVGIIYWRGRNDTKA